ncbi:MAG: ATP-binding protein [Fusobacteria bacterium]|nr:ATP-binding protein [Fusobacteriota bacterium]
MQKLTLTYHIDSELTYETNQVKQTLMMNSSQPNYNPKVASATIPLTTHAVITDLEGKVIYYNNEQLSNVYSAYNIERLTSNGGEQFATVKNIRIGIFPFKYNNIEYYFIAGVDIQAAEKLAYRLTWYLVGIFAILFISAYFLYATEHERYVSEIKGVTRSVRKIRDDNLFFRIDSDYYEKGISDLAQTFNEMLERIEGSFNRVQQFTSDVSHELRTPIASIKNMIEVELSQERSREEYEEILIKVVEEINWLGNMVTDLLMLENLNAASLVKVEINLKTMVEQVVELLSILTVDRNIEMVVNISANTIIHGDKNKIRRVIMNLISNSIKYNRENGKIFISSLTNRKGVLLEVEDTGIGIKKENIQKIFHRFFREDKVRTTKKEGLGLGLAMVKHILSLHEAEVAVQSVEGQGTKISIFFKNE